MLDGIIKKDRLDAPPSVPAIRGYKCPILHLNCHNSAQLVLSNGLLTLATKELGIDPFFFFFEGMLPLVCYRKSDGGRTHRPHHCPLVATRDSGFVSRKRKRLFFLLPYLVEPFSGYLATIRVVTLFKSSNNILGDLE